MSLIAAFVAAGLAVAAFAYWMSLIKRVDLAERRWRVSSMLAGAMVLALAALGLGGGVAVQVLGGASILLGVVYFGLLALAGQSNQMPLIEVGRPLPDFEAPDQNGEEFRLSSRAGRPVLLKFFRGHW
jgi:cytochrome oxidase Cu insertion factor (SCO1/SenC/PrrC family)